MRSGYPWPAVLAAAVVACAARAALVAAKDGWTSAGLWELAAQSFARHFLSGLPWTLPAAALFAARRNRALALPRRWALAALGLPLAWAFIAGRLPLLPYHAPGFQGARALAAQGAAAAAAVVTIALLVRFRDAGSIARRALAFGAAAIVAAAGFARAVAWLTPASSSSRPNVIVISLDTVRRDRLSCYGYGRPTTPEIDRFAQSAARFQHAYCPEAWTLTSHMSLLTSLTPLVHGVDETRGLPPGVTTLAAEFRRAGYVAAAQVDDIGWLHPWFGFDRGFHVYRRVRGDARAKNEALTTLLDDVDGAAPFFLLLHYFDAHGDWDELPYESPPHDVAAFTSWYAGSFRGCDERGRCGATLLRAWNEEATVPPDDVLRYVSSLYDAGLRALDRDLGELFRDLEERGLFENSVVVLTADHGEEFFEHGKVLHRQLYSECSAVPLIVRRPDATPATLAHAVGLVDLAPTLLELAGVPVPTAMQGRSFAALVRGGSDPVERRFVVLQSDEDRGLFTERHHLLRRDGALELYDVATDPGEQRDLVAGGAHARETAELLALLAADEARGEALRASASGAPAARAGIPAAERERLRALGYVEGDR